jgi:hypothetical protein
LAQYLAGQGEQLPVRLVITGGEALTGEHLQRIRQRSPRSSSSTPTARPKPWSCRWPAWPRAVARRRWQRADRPVIGAAWPTSSTPTWRWCRKAAGELYVGGAGWPRVITTARA